ncbi:MAG: hypothetical protein ACJ72E_08985 [Marmoricola sp.]
MSDHDDPTTGSGRGGPLGVPTSTGNTQPPSADQDANEAVSGGGIVDEDAATEEKNTAKETGPHHN